MAKGGQTVPVDRRYLRLVSSLQEGCGGVLPRLAYGPGFPKPKVTGSSPVGTASSFSHLLCFNDLAACLCKRDVMFVTSVFLL